MIRTQEDVNNFLNDVLPPEKEPTGWGSDQGIRFINALALALKIEQQENNTIPLQALRDKYPEATEKYMSEAENLVRVSA